MTRQAMQTMCILTSLLYFHPCLICRYTASHILHTCCYCKLPWTEADKFATCKAKGVRPANSEKCPPISGQPTLMESLKFCAALLLPPLSFWTDSSCYALQFNVTGVETSRMSRYDSSHILAGKSQSAAQRVHLGIKASCQGFVRSKQAITR